jgi:predicted RNA binding protein YcfA (HicA-like mRNA interferase family)
LPKLPVVSGPELIAALGKMGFTFSRQQGSHVILVNRDTGKAVSVPVHGNWDLPPGTLRTILREAGLDGDDLRRLLDR